MGRHTSQVGIGRRHTHQAVNAAFTRYQLMVDTLPDPKALGQKAIILNAR
jgi:hypothetical protein